MATCFPRERGNACCPCSHGGQSAFHHERTIDERNQWAIIPGSLYLQFCTLHNWTVIDGGMGLRSHASASHACTPHTRNQIQKHRGLEEVQSVS
jgi:hypothetical protein